MTPDQILFPLAALAALGLCGVPNVPPETWGIFGMVICMRIILIPYWPLAF